MNIVLFILLYFTLYFLIIRILKNIRLRFEKLEELEGEFIFTYLRKLSKKEIYFSLEEIKTVFFTRMIIKNDEFDKLTLFIILEDDYAVRLQKKENIILFFKSCKENNPEMYDKFLKNAPMGINISAIMDKEIENYKEKQKGNK